MRWTFFLETGHIGYEKSTLFCWYLKEKYRKLKLWNSFFLFSFYHFSEAIIRCFATKTIFKKKLKTFKIAFFSTLYTRDLLYFEFGRFLRSTRLFVSEMHLQWKFLRYLNFWRKFISRTIVIARSLRTSTYLYYRSNTIVVLVQLLILLVSCSLISVPVLFYAPFNVREKTR